MFILLHSGTKNVSTSYTSRRELVFVAGRTVELFVLKRERLVDQRRWTRAALEAFVMPVPIFIRQILEICRDRRFAGLAHVGELLFVALFAVRLVVAQYVTLPDQIHGTQLAAELSTAPVLLRGLREVGREQQLVMAKSR